MVSGEELPAMVPDTIDIPGGGHKHPPATTASLRRSRPERGDSREGYRMSVGSGESGEHDCSRLRVVECGSGVSASYATKLLADVGADVIKVESPRGDVTRER